MNDLFPSFFDGRKPAFTPAKGAKVAKIHAGDLQTLAPLATSAGGDGRIGETTLKTLAPLATLAGPKPKSQHASLAAPCVSTSTECEPWAARAASLERDAGLPSEWAALLARLLCGAPPGDFDSSHWARVAEGASIFAERWAAQAFRLGWSTREVFGLDEIAPSARHDRKGVAWFLTDGRRVVALDRGGADIETVRGVRQRFYRDSERERDELSIQFRSH